MNYNLSQLIAGRSSLHCDTASSRGIRYSVCHQSRRGSLELHAYSQYYRIPYPLQEEKKIPSCKSCFQKYCCVIMLTPSSITWGDFFDTLDGITALYMIVVIVSAFLGQCHRIVIDFFPSDPGILAVRNSDRGPIESRYSHHDLAFSSPQILRFAYPRYIFYQKIRTCGDPDWFCPSEIARTLNGKLKGIHSKPFEHTYFRLSVKVRKQVKMLLGPSPSTTYASLFTAPRSTFGCSFSDCPYGVKSI